MQENLKKIIGSLDRLPTLPAVSVKVNALLRSPSAGAGELARVIENDQSITASLLALANSAFYALPRKVVSVKEAISFIGFGAVTQIVLGLGALNTFRKLNSKGFDREQFWLHCVGVAVLSRSLAKASRYPRPDDAFTAGLLHDIGKVALDAASPESFASALAETKTSGGPFYLAERKVLGVDHGTIGEWVTRNWELPLLIVVSARYHHDEPKGRTGLQQANDPCVDLVRVADWLVVTSEIGFSGSAVAEEPGAETFAHAGISMQTARGFIEAAKSEVVSTAALFGIKT
jgi:two-component system, cell cycle response regulator